ncbi:hypothetical protein AALO_G00082740 [Alosa alosa]|uniref:Nucleosome-remodeling factor subunit BPTF-like n=1 Tax=Alosa alosa TaxID=278164 RepID=A0AAV6GXQ7_9TELE|nr:hypothetical protein AALO_G00082740 [Alosa alosa]
MRGRRGRPPKTQLMQEPSSGPVRGLRPRRGLRAKGRGTDEVDFEIPKRGNYHSTRGRRRVGSTTVSRGRGRGRGGGRGRGRGRGKRSAASSLIVYDDHESDDEDAESLRSDEEEYVDEEPITDEEEDAIDDESDYPEEIPEEDDDDASYCTESSSHGSAQGRRKTRVVRPRSPVFEEVEIPALELPRSSEDLLIPAEQLLNAAAIYEVLRNFSTVLRLSTFRFEDFCAALAGQEQCTLVAETHVSLLKAILREEDSSNTTFGPADLKDSVNSTLYFIDGMTWPEVVRAYCESDPEYRPALRYQQAEGYPFEPLESKVKVLQFLVDQFLTTNLAREELLSEGTVQYDDHCRVCHRLGDLLCCETCSAVYHLECVKPPLEEVPEDEWQCEVCVAHKVPGVSDCITEVQNSRPYIRQEPIGYDRHSRKYWFLNRRIIIEEDGEHDDKKIWYYSTKVQLAELIDVLDREYWESDLCSVLDELREEIHSHMAITEELTNKARNNNRSYLEAASDEIMERRKTKEEAELEEVKRCATEEAEKARQGSEVGDASADGADREQDKTVCGMDQQTSGEPTSAEAPSTGVDDSSPSASSAFDQPKPTSPVAPNSTSTSTKSVSTSPEKGAQDGPSQAEETGNDGSASTDADKEPADKSSEKASLGEESAALQSVDENSCSSHVSASDPPRGPEEPDLADRSSRSSFTSLDDQGEGKANGEPGKGGSATRIVTRLRNPDSKLSQLKSQLGPTDGTKTSKEFPAFGEGSRFGSVRKDLMPKGNLNTFFKLGQEGKYRVYQNQYSTNTVALNKHQHREDHDKRRHLSHKFCMTPAGEFKWNGSVHGSRVLTVSTLRLTIIQLETNIPAPFLHPNWASHRTNWTKAVQMCSKAREFALALAILECAIKPVVMLPVWKDALGHTRLHRMTSMEREEKEKMKKKEKKLEDEETLQQATWVKYTFPIKHQVWKQKGEEYRVTGYGGWSWISKTHVHRFVPKFPGNTNVNYRKNFPSDNKDKQKEEKDLAASNTDSEVQKTEVSPESAAEKDEDQKPTPESPAEDSSVEEQTRKENNEGEPQTKDRTEVQEETGEKANGHAKEEEAEKMDVDPSTPDYCSNKEKDKISRTGSPAPGEEHAVKEEPEGEEVPNPSRVGPSLPFNHDVVNVSEGFQLRTAYKKKVKTSKLDGLLERRVRQFTLEEKQRLERLKMSELAGNKSVKETLSSQANVRVSSGDTIKAEEAVNTKEQEKSLPIQVEEKESLNVETEKDPVVQRLEFDQEEAKVKSGVAAEQKDSESTPATTGEIQTPSETSQTQMNSGCVNDNVSIASTASDGHGSNDQSNGRSERPSELNGGSQEALNPSPSQNVTPNSLMEAPSVKSEGTAQMVLGENGNKHTGEGNERCVVKDEGESMDVHERDYVRTENSGLLQVNGNEAPVFHNKASTLMDLASNVTSNEEPTTLGGGINAKDPLKPLTNGDAVTLDSRKENTNSLENKAERTATELASDCPIPQKVSRLENNVDEASADSTVTSSALEGRTETPDTTKMEVDVTKLKQLAPSPVTSMEESSLSSDAAENGGGNSSGSSNSVERKTTLTQVTTTTTTSSTTTVSTVQIDEVTSSSSVPPVPEPKSRPAAPHPLSPPPPLLPKSQTQPPEQ